MLLTDTAYPKYSRGTINGFLYVYPSPGARPMFWAGGISREWSVSGACGEEDLRSFQQALTWAEALEMVGGDPAVLAAHSPLYSF